ncbi:MAG: hypothetical protein ACLFS3_03270 [Candidatus Aenigmatarchaeota archaeon]
MFESRKGQYLSAEQMLLFSLGIVITISIYFSFTSIHGKVQGFTQEDQMEEVAYSVVSSLGKIETMSTKFGTGQTNITLNISIPRTISNDPYLINVTENRVLVEQDSKEVTVGLAGFQDRFEVEGEVHSGRNAVRIDKVEKTITLSG